MGRQRMVIHLGGPCDGRRRIVPDDVLAVTYATDDGTVARYVRTVAIDRKQQSIFLLEPMAGTQGLDPRFGGAT